MLVINLRTTKKVMVGNHTVITLMKASGSTAQMGFVSRDRVSRVNDPESIMRAARIEARVGQNAVPARKAMEHIPVYVATNVIKDENDGWLPTVKAALMHLTATYPQAEVVAINDTTQLAPAHHRFLVMRCATPEAAKAVKLALPAANRPYLDELEMPDATIYLLFVYTTDQPGNDVEYIDLTRGSEDHD